MANKVKFNLKNVHYAIIDSINEGIPTYSAPVRIPGAVSLTLSAEGKITPFYADGIVYYNSVANNGYTGDLEIALIPESYRVDVIGEKKDEISGILSEFSDVQPKEHAIMFQFDGDEKGIRHVLYNTTVTRPSTSGSTTTDTKEPQTETLSLSATPLENGLVKARTGDDTPDSVYDEWFKAVWTLSA